MSLNVIITNINIECTPTIAEFLKSNYGFHVYACIDEENEEFRNSWDECGITTTCTRVIYTGGITGVLIECDDAINMN